MAYTPIIQPTNISTKSAITGGVQLINSITLGSEKLDSSAGSFQLTVSGTSDALFDLQVQRSSDSRYYNFDTRTFAAAYSNKSRNKKLSPGTYSIEVPAASGGDTYAAQVYTSPAYNTELSSGNKYFTSVTKKQFKDSVVTLAVSGDLTEVDAQSIGTLTGSTIKQTRSTIKMVDKTISVQDATADHGFFIKDTTRDLNNGTWNQSAMYWQSGNYTANGAGTNSTSLILTSVDGLVVGMQVAFINSTYQSVLRAITAINTTTKTVTLDGNETWSDTHVIIFRAYGPSLINDAIGIKLSVDSTTVRLGQTTTSIRTEITSDVGEGTDIAVNGTRGIAAGATIRMRGIEKSSESTACVVGTISVASTTAGNITINNGEILASSDRPVRVKTKIYIDGSSNQLFLTGKINVTKFPDANQSIFIDTDQILTPGQSS